MIKYFFIALLFLFSVIFYSCSDDPSSVGSRLLEQDYLNVDTLSSSDGAFEQTSSYFKKVISLGNSSRLLIGKKDDLIARTLISFVFLIPDSLKTDFNEGTVTIDTAIIEIFPNYVYVDSLASFDFTAHKILSAWSSSGFSADSFSTLQYEPDNIILNKSFLDSVYQLRVSTQLAREWVDYAMNPDSLTNYGILISPDATTGKILGFEAFDPFTELDSRIKLIISKQGSYTDTLIGFVASDISFVEGEEPVEDEYMLVQSSLTLNSKLHFDLSSIPPNVVINRATLVIQSDSTKNVFGAPFENSVIAYIINDPDSNTVNSDLFIRLTGSGHSYSGEVTAMIRYWLNSNNYGMLLRSGSEQVGLELFYLYGSNALDVSKRPYLEIVYSYN